MNESQSIDKSIIEELYTFYPVSINSWTDPDMIHPASSTEDPSSPLFIAKRNKNGLPEPVANIESRHIWPGYDFINDEAFQQFKSWTSNMYNASWYNKSDFSSLPITREAESLAEYCLAFWAHAIQEGTMTISMHARKRFGGRDQSLIGGFALLNGQKYVRLTGNPTSVELRDTVPALQGAFGVPDNEVAVNLIKPFPHRNVWDIPGGKMLVIPRNYYSPGAGISSVRLIPNRN